MDIEALLREELASIDYARWEGTIGGSDVTLIAKPITPADIAVLRRKHPTITSAPGPDAMVALIVRKALNEQTEKPMFQPKHEPLLLRMTTEKVGEIFMSLFGAQFEELEDPDGEKHEERVGNS